MTRLRALWLTSLLCCAAVAAPFNERIEAQGLLGSYFGVPGQPVGIPQTFDYVVVGGGTAGLTIASRLADENCGYSVAVVEAGGFYEFDNGNISSIPADAVYFSGSDPSDTQPLVDWSDVSVPQAVRAENLIAVPRYGKYLDRNLPLQILTDILRYFVLSIAER